MKPFRAARGGEVVARLDPAEAGILGLLLDQLEQLLAAESDDVAGDPVLARLFPEGHRGDAALAADFRSLTEEDLTRIVDLQLAQVEDRLAGRRITLHVTDEAKSALAREGFDPAFGARPLKRVIQREIGDRVATAILEGNVGEGDTVTVDAVDGALVLR